MDRRQLLGATVGLLGLGAIATALLAPASDEELIAQVLDDLALSLSFSEPIANPIFFGSNLSEKFEDILSEHVQISVSEVAGSIPSARGKLGLIAARALSRYASLRITLSIDELTVQGDSAHCAATAEVTGNDGAGLRSDSRSVVFDLVKDGGDWLISSARVEAPE